MEGGILVVRRKPVGNKGINSKIVKKTFSSSPLGLEIVLILVLVFISAVAKIRTSLPGRPENKKRRRKVSCAGERNVFYGCKWPGVTVLPMEHNAEGTVPTEVRL